MTSLTQQAHIVWTSRTTRLIVIATLVGSGAGLGAVLLIESIKWVSATGVDMIAALSLGDWGILLVLPVGLWVSWRVTARFAPEVAGHGVPQILAAIAVRGGVIRQRVIPLKTVATAFTIGVGGSAGREGSIAQIGSAIGSALARLARLNENDVVALVAAGAGAGISATFNAPIAGMFFAMEVVLREISIRHLHTVVIASVSGAVVAHSILGDELTFDVPPYSLDDPRQLLLYAGLGLVALGFGWFFLVALDWFDVQKIPLPDWARPVLFGLVVAGLGLVWHDTLGTGQGFIDGLLTNGTNLAWWTLGTLAFVKAIATAATLGGKGSGGIFMPSLFIGASAGAGFARLIAPAWRFSEISPGAFGLVGMAAAFSAVARAPLTSILIVFEITGDYGLVLPLMVATVISTALAGRVRPESAYTAPLLRKGIHPARGAVTDLLETITVRDTMGIEPVTVGPQATLRDVQDVMTDSRMRGIPVVHEGSLLGVITEGDILRNGGPSDDILVSSAMTPNPVTASPTTPVSDALERMAALGVGRLPIVAEDDRNRLVGVFSRDDVVLAYHRALGAHSRSTSVRDRPSQGATDPGAGFFDLQIPIGSSAVDRRVSEIQWPEGSLLVSIHRGSRVIVPDGSTLLRSGDSMTVFGQPESRDRLVERLIKTGSVDDQESSAPPV